MDRRVYPTRGGFIPADEGFFMRRTLLALAVVVDSIGVWFLLGRWLPSGSERFYLLFPIAAIATYLAATPNAASQLRSQLVPAAIYVGILTLLCFLYNLYMAAEIVPDGSGRLLHQIQLKQVLIPAYFFSAVSLIVIVPLRLLRAAVCKLDDRCFGPFAEAKNGRFPRTLLREVAPAVVTVPLLLPYFMGVVYVHRFKMPNTSDPQQILHRDFEDVAFTTSDGMEIRGWFLPAKKPSARTLIICHGLGANRSNFLPYCEVGDVLGANVLMFDFRGHGDSDGHTVSFGHRERFDVLAALQYLREKRPDQAREVYGLGISMGSSALLQAAAEASPPFDGVIVDSAFASATELTDNILADFPAALRPYMATCGVPIASLHAGCWLPDVKPIESAAHIVSPILFIHAKDDTLIPVSHTERLLQAVRGPKDAFFTERGGHSSSLRSKKEYLAFVKRIDDLR
jgi:alpha-beta hydrolase superfamily lysophospholipase